MNASFANPCRNTQNEDGDTCKGTQMSVGPKKNLEAQAMQTREPHPPELMGELGKEIYEQDIKHLVEPDHNEEIVAIDVDSRKWALATEPREAVENLRQTHPEAFNILCVRVKSWAVDLMRKTGTGDRH